MPLLAPYVTPPQPQNPNWPVVDIAVSFSSGPFSSMPSDYWCSVNNRTLGQITTNRGRQYELDQVQTGTWAGALENTDAALDPNNSSSQFYPQVLPYRAFRHRMQYPATVNILTADQASGLYASQGYVSTSTLPANVYQTSSGLTSLTITAGSGIPANRYTMAYPSGCHAGNGMRIAGWSVQPGATYTAQANLNLSNSTAMSSFITLRWFDINGATISNSSVNVTLSTTDTVYTVTGTAPDNAAGAELRITNSTVPSSTVSMLAREIQLEVGTSASSWVTPGEWYPVFTGYVERWPQSWSMNGQFGMSNLTCVDAFGFLSQRKLLSAAYMEMLTSLSPSWLYPLDEASGLSFYDLTAQYPPVTTSSYPNGSGGVAAGTSLPGNSNPYGISGPVVSFTNSTSSQSIEVIDLATRGVAGPPRSGSWTRIFAFQMTAPLSHSPGLGNSYIWFCSKTDFSVALAVTITYNPATGGTDLYWSGTGFSGNPSANIATSISTTGWHLVAISYDGSNLITQHNGSSPITTALTGGPAFGSSPMDLLGGDDYQTSFNGFTGNMALAAELPYAMSSSQFSRLWSVFNYGGSGLGSASSASRYTDILRWGNWPGLQAVDSYTSGQTNAYGPATELSAPASSSGTDVVSALQTVVDTEAGTHYVAADGTITFKARRARYNQGSPAVTFGENTAAGEIPYTLIRTGYDPTRVANDVSTVQTQTQLTQRAVDQTSITDYGDIQLQRTVNTLNPYEQSDAAQYLLRRNSQPVQRVEGISVNVGANPALWQAMLSLEQGTRVRAMRRPPGGAATIQVDGFVEQINWTFDDKGHAAVDLQISVNNSQQYWQLDDATYSVLGTTTIIGY